MTKTALETWKRINPKSIIEMWKVSIADKYKEEIDKGILNILEEIQSIRDEDTVGGYYDKTNGINTTLHEYYLEVTAVEDSIVIGKIVGSRHPVYNVRKGDWIYITK